MRVITLNSDQKIIGVKNVLDNYTLQDNEMISDFGELGQIRQADGTFADDTTPQPIQCKVATNSLDIIKAYSATQPQNVTIIDKTTYWDITVTRNITANGSGYDYEYIEFPAPKGTETQEELTTLIIAKKDEIFANAQYPLSEIYQGATNGTDLLKLTFTLMDKIASLETTVNSLKGGA